MTSISMSNYWEWICVLHNESDCRDCILDGCLGSYLDGCLGPYGDLSGDENS